jgi:hypothetical protein
MEQLNKELSDALEPSISELVELIWMHRDWAQLHCIAAKLRAVAEFAEGRAEALHKLDKTEKEYVLLRKRGMK